MKYLTDNRPVPMLSKYLMNGSPHNCAFCSNPLQGEVWRKHTAYYCTEYCADLAAEQQRKLS
jgi:hypothetical protein